MAFNPLSLVKKAASSIVGHIPIAGPLLKDAIDKIGDAEKAIDQLPPEARAAFEMEQQKLAVEEFRLVLRDSANMRKLAMAELEHPGIKWIRPGILAGLFLIIVFWTVGVPLLSATGVSVPPPDISAIPTELWWMFGASYLGYGTMREIGKHNKLKAGGNGS